MEMSASSVTLHQVSQELLGKQASFLELGEGSLAQYVT